MESVELTHGKTGYRVLGSLEEAEELLLVFGGFHFPRNCDMFLEDLHRCMEEASPGTYALLSYDYYGRGESASPEAHYNAEFYVQQAEELLLRLGVLSSDELSCSDVIERSEGNEGGKGKGGDKDSEESVREDKSEKGEGEKEECKEESADGDEEEEETPSKVRDERECDEKNERVLFAGKKFSVLGYSFGGATSTQFVSRHRERVSKWVLSGAWVTWTAFPAATTVMVKTSLTAALLYKCYWMAMHGALEKGFENAKSEENQRIIAGMKEGEKPYLDADPEALKRALLSTFAHFRDTKRVMTALAPLVEEEQSPNVLFAWGDNDQIAPYALAEQMHQLMPTASALEPIDGNHNDIWLVDERAHKFREALLKFFL